MDTMYLTLIKTCESMIKSHTDTIQRYESGEDIPKGLYDIAKESLPQWEEQLNKIKTSWPTD